MTLNNEQIEEILKINTLAYEVDSITISGNRYFISGVTTLEDICDEEITKEVLLTNPNLAGEAGFHIMENLDENQEDEFISFEELVTTHNSSSALYKNNEIKIVKQATANEIAQSIQSSIVIKNVEFTIEDFKGRGENYTVEVYAQDPEESDMYTVRIYDEDGAELQDFFVDSCGGTTENVDDELSSYIMDVLFSISNKGIIRGF